MIDTFLRKRDLREETDMQLISPEGMPMGTAGPAMAEAVKAMLAERKIPYRPLTEVQGIDHPVRELVLESGERVPYDLLIAVPPHRSPTVVREAGLTNEAGWIAVDAATFTTPFEGVFAIGDVTTIPLPGRFNPEKPLVLPKAGVFAHKQAEVLAHNIAIEITGQGVPQAFDGQGGCFIELGDGRAGYGEGNFYAPGAPEVSLRPPARRWHWVKVLIEKYWLWRWFVPGRGGLHVLADRILFR
jgi:sulfide:quinone oxidoreductase